MWSLSLTLTEVLVGLVVFVVALYFLNGNKIYKSLPPGPWGFPILGHIPFFGSNPAKTFMNWKKTHGPMFTVRFGSIPTVILNDINLIKEAFNMPEFSGRPLIPVMLEISNRRGPIFTDGPMHTDQRRFTIKTLTEFGVGSSSVEIRMHEEIAAFLTSTKLKVKELRGKPMKMNKLFRFSVINSLWDSVMGGRFEESDPTLLNLIKFIDQGTDTNSSIVAQLFWFFPWVAKLGNSFGFNPPVHGFQGVYKYIEKEIMKLRATYVKGQSNHFTDAYFEKVDGTTDLGSSFHASHNQQPITTADLFMAAIDTTIITLDWLMIYMALNPKIQRTLQAEIDTVIGLDKSRAPCLQDKQNMPFTEAVLQEILRIAALVPFAIFHRTLSEVTFQGYTFPKNTMVIPNLYAVHRDPDVWEEPDKFNPSRFLDEKGQFRKGSLEIAPFSVGRRICLGKGFARDQLFLLTTNFFREFKVSCTDKVPSLEPNFGIVLYPDPFELIVQERD